MAKNTVVICCWGQGHVNELSMTNKQEEKLSEKISTLKAVCPTCRNDDLGNQPIMILHGATIFNSSKAYQCRNGHVTSVGAFTNGMLHVKVGNDREDSENIEGTIEELQELIDKKSISCHHVRENGRRCGCKLKPMDDTSLQYPSEFGIKTKTRVGDLWDKAGINPVRTGTYDGDGHYHKGTGEEGNKARLTAMRRRSKSNSKSPGKTITKATTKNYGQRSKSSVNPERLK